MNVALWIAQGLLALAFLAVGAGKLAQPKKKLADRPQMDWVNDFPAGALKLLGVAEVAGALAVVLPRLTGVATVITPVAAVGLAVLCFTSVPSMAKRGQYAAIIPNVALFALAVFVAWGRF